MTAAEVSRRITDVLGLEMPPISLVFTDEAPAGLPGPARTAPSACAFWRDAEEDPFFASAERHYNCPVGAMVMGFRLPEEVKQELGEAVTGMCEQKYLSPDEAPNLPTVQERPGGTAEIVYAPLADGPMPPDVVLLWVAARQAMLCNEAIGTASWLTGSPVVSGRPGCAALPLALDGDAPAFSLGCTGMRTYTGIGDDRLLLAIQGPKLEEFADVLERIGAANDHMEGYYRERRERVETADDA